MYHILDQEAHHTHFFARCTYNLLFACMKESTHGDPWTWCVGCRQVRMRCKSSTVSLHSREDVHDNVHGVWRRYIPPKSKSHHSHFAPGEILPTCDDSDFTRPSVPRAFPQGTNLAPPPFRSPRLRGAFKKSLSRSVHANTSTWTPRAGADCQAAGCKSDVRQPLSLAWHPSQLGTGTDGAAAMKESIAAKWLGVQLAAE